MAVIDRLAARAQKRVGGLPYIDEDDRFLAITIWLILWGFAILFLASIVWLVGSLVGLWHGPDFGSHCDPTYGCPE